jgi:hypothetical protein
MARIDKYDPISGGFRAPLAAAMAKNSDGNPVGVGLDANGRVVPGAGTSGVKGLVSVTRDMAAGDIVDVMTDGEMVEFTGTAGTTYFAATANGVLSTTNTGIYVGHTVEATRLVVRMRPSGGAA